MEPDTAAIVTRRHVLASGDASAAMVHGVARSTRLFMGTPHRPENRIGLAFGAKTMTVCEMGDLMDDAAPQRPTDAPRFVAAYLRNLRPVLDSSTAARKSLVRDVGMLIEQARAGERDVVIETAERVGREQADALQRIRLRLSPIEPPPVCETCHLAVIGWLDKQIAACEALTGVSVSGDLSRLREAQGLLAEARGDAHRFVSEYERLLTELKGRLAAARESRRAQPKGLRTRWTFRRRPESSG